MNVVCIYGIAPISIEGELIFLEEDPEAFKAFVPTDKTHAYLIERGNEEQIFKEIAWKFLFVPVSYHTTGSSRELEIFAAFEEIRTGVHLVASDFSDFGKKVFANVVKNMERLPQSYDGSRWFGSFKNVPAIICAAGPSFAKNSAHLKTLTERALLIGGGSALNVLAHAGIVPHVAASIDPDPPHDRWEGQTALDIPFFYHHRVASHLLAQVQGPTFWIKDAQAHPVEKWFYDHLQLEGPALEGGWNVATFSIALAAALGCNPIIFVGLDLRLEEGQLYAPGVSGERKRRQKIGRWPLSGSRSSFKPIPKSSLSMRQKGGAVLAALSRSSSKTFRSTPRKICAAGSRSCPKLQVPMHVQASMRSKKACSTATTFSKSTWPFL